ncbi:helix-turn-helix transcriptional regulator [Saccharothrix sp. BKS2]|uniref:helix-turn-helix domain-containing protein n=1 Tax=Saccharothrix sp. BKS2 TaxID=3064400 RepID=UPI0039EBDD76
MDTEENAPPVRPGSAHSRELGGEIRRTRQNSGRSAPKVAEALGWSVGKLSKLEKGTRGTSTVDIAALLGHCGAAKAARERVLGIAAEPDTGSFLRLHHQRSDRLVAVSVHEEIAETITVYDPVTVPDLARTEDYTLALTGDLDFATALAERQRLLQRHPDPHVTVYVHEMALRMAVGGPAVMRDQLLHLLLMCEWPRTTVRVVPLAAGFHTHLRHPCTLLAFEAPDKPLAYTETDVAVAFHDAPEAVAAYQQKMCHLDAAALDTEQTRRKLSRWTDLYDRKAA